MPRYTSGGFILHLMHVELSAHAIFIIGQGACVKKLSGKAKLEDSRATKPIVALLSAPLEKYSNIVTALELSNYPRVMDYLDNATTKAMAVVIIQSIMKNTTCISTSDKVKVSC
jgi:vacuolar protein sorting-associated protein 35